MAIRHIFPLFAVLTATVLVTGCGKSNSTVSSATSEEESLLGDILGDIDLTETGPPVDDTLAGLADPAEPLASLTIPHDDAPTQKLELRLAEGDRFPLVKTVEQTLVQKSDQFPATAETTLTLYMDLSVDEVRPDAVLLTVKYTQVQYGHDLNGQQLHFDSKTHQGGLPLELLPYAGMVNNGFSFWLGRDNKVREVVGYQNFLQQCVANAPPAAQQRLVTEMANRIGEGDGVAGFIDDSIGLLPYDSNANPGNATQVAEGDEWIRERRVDQPVPLRMTSTCRLVSLNDATAEINIAGKIDIEPTVMPARMATPQVTITGGRSTGTCTVDRVTGLPRKVTRREYLNLTVTMPSGQSVQQDKQIQTTIETFPNQRRPVVDAGTLRAVPPPTFSTTISPRHRPTGPQGAASRAIQTVSGVPGRGRATTIPTEAPPRVLHSTATAAYPD